MSDQNSKNLTWLVSDSDNEFSISQPLAFNSFFKIQSLQRLSLGLLFYVKSLRTLDSECEAVESIDRAGFKNSVLNMEERKKSVKVCKVA